MYVKFLPNDYVLRYRKGKLIESGAGLSFHCLPAVTSAAVVPISAMDADLPAPGHWRLAGLRVERDAPQSSGPWHPPHLRQVPARRGRPGAGRNHPAGVGGLHQKQETGQ